MATITAKTSTTICNKSKPIRFPVEFATSVSVGKDDVVGVGVGGAVVF